MLSHHHGNDHDVIAGALGAMKQVTQCINEVKREHERALRAVEIRRLLDGWSSIDLALLGHLVMEVCTSQSIKLVRISFLTLCLTIKHYLYNILISVILLPVCLVTHG